MPFRAPRKRQPMPLPNDTSTGMDPILLGKPSDLVRSQFCIFRCHLRIFRISGGRVLLQNSHGWMVMCVAELRRGTVYKNIDRCGREKRALVMATTFGPLACLRGMWLVLGSCAMYVVRCFSKFMLYKLILTLNNLQLFCLVLQCT